MDFAQDWRTVRLVTRLEQEAAEAQLLQRFAAAEDWFLQKQRCVN